MYHEHRLLWNGRLTDNKNRNKRHDALLEISVSVRTDKDEIEKKIRYLSSHFTAAHLAEAEWPNATEKCMRTHANFEVADFKVADRHSEDAP